MAFWPGDRVEITGLTGATELNGKVGTVVKWSEAKERFIVDVVGLEKPVAVRAANLSSADEAGWQRAAIAAGALDTHAPEPTDVSLPADEAGWQERERRRREANEAEEGRRRALREARFLRALWQWQCWRWIGTQTTTRTTTRTKTRTRRGRGRG